MPTSNAISPGYLTRVFLPTFVYQFDFASCHEKDAECFICRDAYSTYTGSGCRALRLTHCGHLIGETCFKEWIRRHPETCPYWNHHLPRISLKKGPPDEALWVRCVSFLTSTTWIQFCDKFIADYPRVCEPMVRKLERLATCTTDRNEALAVWQHYLKHVVILTRLMPLIFALLVFAVVAFPAVLLGKTQSMWVMMVMVVKVLVMGVYLNAVLFLGVARTVVLVSVQRSSRARAQRGSKEH